MYDMITKRIANDIEKDIKDHWGWVVQVTVTDTMQVSWKGNNPDRYDMYPEMTKEQADTQVMSEIRAIIRKYIPRFEFTYYEQSGKVYKSE